MSSFVFILVSTFFGITSQLALKHGMGKVARREGSLILRMLTTPWVVGGLVAYGSGVLFWLLALSRLEISFVYPFASLAYVGIIIGSYAIFKERITPLRIVGIIVIISGVILIGLSAA